VPSQPPGRAQPATRGGLQMQTVMRYRRMTHVRAPPAATSVRCSECILLEQGSRSESLTLGVSSLVPVAKSPGRPVRRQGQLNSLGTTFDSTAAWEPSHDGRGLLHLVVRGQRAIGQQQQQQAGKCAACVGWREMKTSTWTP
jgi:hypothetical protein